MSESVETFPPSVELGPDSFPAVALKPRAREWLLHAGLFLLTVVTTTFAGIVNSAPDIDVPEPPLRTVLDYVLYVPTYYFRSVATLLTYALLHPRLLTDGVAFSVALLAILTAHEMGHYIACRRYGVSATLPFFLPAPPLFLAGTFGAFIKIKSPIPTRRALFDIGLAGPLAGFVVAVPIAVIGILTLRPAPPVIGHAIIFNDPILFRLIARAAGIDLTNSFSNPYYMAAWIGLLVTALNLMPVGQLDGGHGTFAVLGQQAHKLIGRVAFVFMAVLSLLGYLWHGSPSGFLFTVVLGVMLRVGHPEPREMEPLGRNRKLVAIVTLIVFVLSFWPFPITIT
jgi:membrane-associated protease RseP (regulator of RpoE activity)